MEAGIPDKIFFKIGEVSGLTLLKPSVLRYWESEFSVLQPTKSPSGQRLYSRKDLETIEEIKRLLYKEKLTIDGARKRLSNKKSTNKCLDVENRGATTNLREIIDELRYIKDIL
jgi:DNA-binding transcriptional MerR regulator